MGRPLSRWSHCWVLHRRCVSSLGKRETHDIGSNTEHIPAGPDRTGHEDPDVVIRNHDDRTGKYHNYLLGGAAEEGESLSTVDGEEHGTRKEDLDALAAAQEAEALASLASANRALKGAREKQHQARQSRAHCPQQQRYRDRPSRRQGGCVECSGPLWASHCPKKKGKPDEKEKGDDSTHTACSEFA